MKTFFFVGLIPSMLFIVFRGNVGTDTGNYLQMVENINFNPEGSHNDFDVEVGFYFLLKVLAFIFPEPHFVVNLISFFILLYCFKLFSKNDNRFLIFTLLLFPVFVFDMTMNGVRYGLAFLLAKHASDEYFLNKKLNSILLLVACISFQLSGLLVFLLLTVKKLRFLSLIYTLFLFVVIYIIFQERLTYKFMAYSEFESPSVTSGFLPLLLFLTCYLNILLVDSGFCKKFMPLLFLEFFSFILARFSYAGLRFQLLILFVFFVLISGLDFNRYGQKKVLLIFLFFIIGVVGFIGTIKHYIDDMGVPPSPFLPYKFFWDEE